VNTGIRIIAQHDRVRLEIGAESTTARLELGAVAWSALELLALTSHNLDGRRVAATNARDLAVRLGTGKDRAAAALRVLRTAGLVMPQAGRDATTSRFAASSYEVRLPVARIDDTIASEEVLPSREAPRPRTRTRAATTPETLDLFSTT
jgi:hypothetical protein